MGFPKMPLHRTSLSSSTPASSTSGFRLWALGFGSSSPGDKSRSVFAVFHHLGGFLRRESREFFAPRSRSWGSPRWGFLLTTEMIHESCLSATPHPSKYLHGCSHPPGSFTVPSSPGYLPSCCLLFENRPASGLYSAARVREVLRCCHLVPRTTSLGFSFKFLRVDFFSSGDSLRGSDAPCTSIERFSEKIRLSPTGSGPP